MLPPGCVAPRGRRSISTAAKQHRLALGGLDAIRGRNLRRTLDVPDVQPHQGLKAHVLVFLALLRSSAARAARRSLAAASTFVATYHGLWDRRCRPCVHGKRLWGIANGSRFAGECQAPAKSQAQKNRLKVGFSAAIPGRRDLNLGAPRVTLKFK